MIKKSRQAFTLLELFAAIAILGALAAIVIPRVFSSQDVAKSTACFVNQGDIEIQVERWLHNTSGMPAGNLSDIGAEINYFPEGLPVCPVDGTAYTIDTQTGLIIGHSH